MTPHTAADGNNARPTETQTGDQRQTLTDGERGRQLELAGIAAWARIELTFVLDHIGWTLRLKGWNTHQVSVDRILKAVDELNAAIHTLAHEVDAAFSLVNAPGGA